MWDRPRSPGAALENMLRLATAPEARDVRCAGAPRVSKKGLVEGDKIGARRLAAQVNRVGKLDAVGCQRKGRRNCGMILDANVLEPEQLVECIADLFLIETVETP